MTSSLNKIVFFIDSLVALGSSNTVPTKQQVDELLRTGWEIVYQWIPDLFGIAGNELVDRLAKAITTNDPITYQRGF